MADTFVQQPIPQPSEVPPVASVPPVMSATPPVMSVPPSPISQKVEPPKSKIGLVVAGVVALVMMVGVGVWGYQKYASSQALIAGIDGGLDTLTGGTTGTNYGTTEDNNTDKNPDNDINDGPTKLELENQCIADGASWDAARSACKYPEGFGPLNPPSEQCRAGDSCPVQCTPDLIASGYTHKTTEPGGGKYCDDQGRECSRYREELMTTSVPGTGTSWCFLGYGEQCGEPGQCGPGTNVRSPSPKPSVPASPNPSPSPTMACTGLTQTPATQPVIGSKLTFTCAGSVTPSNASTLSYNFRYAINNGSWVNLTNKTTATAELTISACGTYKVECRACATFGGLIKCDPFWQYAGVQPL